MHPKSHQPLEAGAEPHAWIIHHYWNKEIPTEEVRVPTENRNLTINTTCSFITDGDRLVFFFVSPPSMNGSAGG